MVKNKATARLCRTFLVWSLSLSLSFTDAIHPEGSPGSCWGWSPAIMTFFLPGLKS